MSAYLNHLKSSDDLVTTYEATRAGFVALALERNRQAAPYIAEAKALQAAASQAVSAADLLKIKDIEVGLLTAAGLSQKSLNYLTPEDKIDAINGLIQNFLEPAAANFVEELVFRFLLTRGDTLGGSMRNIGGALAQRKLTRAILSTLKIAGRQYSWQDSRTKQWIAMTNDDIEIELSLRGINWQSEGENRTLIYNLKVPLVRSNVDLCLFNLPPTELVVNKSSKIQPSETAPSIIALGELKGGIDPAGADEHWKTAQAALNRIREAFSKVGYFPNTFFVGSAVAKRMADEIWHQLEEGTLTNAANLNQENQVASIARWLCNL
ncbi:MULTISPECIES: AvaI/BsoBI family type II restriction endonuclease [Planktothricoides]|uniref:AvaI/BsoBI family type II restriction endonuclease n=2 Tax=Planktothricoides raciborskii TaxID=132608 RepID=A0AAU8JD92_9CYAN|nr:MULTISPECIES: AvaI/BsoBI family type II restriction endonuclease [Planktothricoides]KOR35596.1 restriction endonuclease [Planktothricoides sp. SR001]MBD2544403.1 restriction endonuclease [Planktothricoides raciborskii FACHB-1370]MBD2582250.1 restriction endonuclease [Planktothricoides raciborskii FACHB-1261]